MKLKQKKFLSFFLALVLIVSQMSGIVAQAETETTGNVAVSEGDGVPEALPESKSYFVDNILTANGINDRHTVDAEDLDFVKGKNSFTISFDFKTSTTGLMALGGMNSSDNKDNYISFYVSGNRLGMEIRNYKDGANINTHKTVDVQNVTLTDNNWHTVTYVVSENNSYQIYLDQNQVMNSAANPTHFTGTQGWWDVSSVTIAGINRIGDANSYPYTGSIRNVKMYTQALSADQIVLEHGKILQKTYFSSAQTFDGTEEGVYTAAQEDLPFVKGMKSGTLVANFKTTTTEKQTLVAIDSENDNKFINLYVEGTTVGVDTDNSETLKKTNLDATVADGKWHTLIYKVQAGVGYELYLDGVKVANKEEANATFMASDWGTPETISFGANNGSNIFNGSLKNVKIFTGAISQEQLNKEQGAVEVENPTFLYEDNSIIDAASIVDVSIDAEEISGFTKGSFSFAYALEESAKNSAEKLTLFSLSNEEGTKTGSIYIQPSTETIGFDVSDGNADAVTLASGTSMQDTEYHTITMVFEGTEVSIYFDGTFCEKKATTAEVLQGNGWIATKAALGGVAGAAPLKGYLDTAYVYEGVLSQEQISELHTSQMALTTVLKTEEKGLFDRGDYGVQGYRIPALLTTNKGTLIAAIDERNSTLSDCGNINTVIRRSTDGGKTWGDSITVVDLKSQPYDVVGKSCVMIDPCLIQAENGRIWMLVDMFPEGNAALGFMNANAKTSGGNGYVTAEDGNKYQGLYETVDGQEVLAGTLRGSRMYDLDGKPTDYTVDMGTFLDGFHTKGDMYLNDKYVGNIYLHDKGAGNDSAPYHIHNTMYVWLTYSDDDGLTWSNPVDLTGMVKADWMKFFGAGPGVGLELKNGEHKGRLIFPIYYTNDTGVKGAFGHQSSACIYSDDGGVTWKCSESPNDGRKNNSGVATDSKNPSGISQLTEAQIVELNNGHLLIFMRNTGGNGKVVVARSTDGGETWEDPYDTTAPDVYCQLSVIHYPELVGGKELVVMSNPGGPGGRKNGTLRIGEIGADDKVTWVEETMFCPSSYYAYSCLSYIKDGEIGLLYETLGDTIKYTSFNLEYIKQDGIDMSPHITGVTKAVIRDGEKVADANAVATPGDILEFTVTIDQDVLVKGTPTFRFWINGHSGKDKYATFKGYGENDNQVVFEYKVQNGDSGNLNFMGPKIISDAENYVRSRENYQVTATNLSVNLGSIGATTADVQADMTKSVDIPYEDMTVTAGSEQAAEPISRAFDKASNTVWHSNWNGDSRDKMWVKFDLKSEQAVSGLRYLPRQDSSPNGRITKYEILVSKDDQTYTKAAEGTWSTDTAWKWVQFNELQNVRYVKLVAVETGSNNEKIFASAAELRITKDVAHDHSYSDKLSHNELGHYYACTVEGCISKKDLEEHNYGEYSAKKTGTCTIDGVQIRTCETCEYVEESPIVADGHDFGEWETIQEATQEKPGMKQKVCNDCKTFQQEMIYLESGEGDGDDNTGEGGDDQAQQEIAAAKAELNTVITTANTKNQADYTPESWEAFDTALQAAETAVANENATKADLEAAKTDLEAAMNALVPVQGEGDQEEQHTPSTDWSKDETHHWHACTFEGCEVNQKHDKAAHEWNDGEITKQPTETEKGEKTFTCTVCEQTKKEEIPVSSGNQGGDDSQGGQDNTAQKELAAAKENLTKAIASAAGKKQQEYTADSWTIFQNALKAANELKDSTTATKEALQKAAADLANAIAGLKPAPQTPPAGGSQGGNDAVVQEQQKVEQEKTEIDSLKTQGANLKADEYTTDSWNTYQAALNKVNTLISSGKATSAELNQAKVELKTALGALVKAPATQTPEEKPTEVVKPGVTFKNGTYQFKITSATEAQFTGVATSIKTVKIANTIQYGGKTLKVTSIANKALKGDKVVTKVVLGSNIKNIGNSAFEGCTKLTSVNLKNVTKIGNKAFKKCTSLKKVTIPKKVTNLGKSVFEGCTKLSTITIKATALKRVGKNTFKNISAKAKIKVPKKNLAKYKKLLKNKGQGKKVSIK